MLNENVFMLPSISRDAGVNLYEVVDISNGRYLGLVGIIYDAHEDFDAVYGWETPFGSRSTDPYRNASDAVEGLTSHVLASDE